MILFVIVINKIENPGIGPSKVKYNIFEMIPEGIRMG